MAPLFENSYIRDEAIHREVLFRFRLLSPVYILCYLFCAYCLYQFFTVLILWDYIILRFLIIPLLFLLLLIYSCRRNARMLQARDLEINNGQPLRIYLVVTQEGITSYDPNGSATIPFDRIRRVTQSKNLIFLITKARVIWIFPKATFIRCNPEDFLSFLKTKGLRVR